MKACLFLKLILSPILLLVLISCDSNSNRIYQQPSQYSFEETLINLDIAISEHNYRIIHRSNIGQAIRERGQNNYPLSTITTFCNITYAKEMMEINPNLINEMPCNIAVRQQDNLVIVSTKLMDTHTNNSEQNKFAVMINDNLVSIIEATIE
jgi:uncharacterized protein (DUF302 family)